MPVAFRQSGYRFFFYSNEGDPREPIHIHVMKDGCTAKFWLEPSASRRVPASMREPCANWNRSSKTGLKTSGGHGVSISAKSVRFDDDSFWVELSDGRTLGVPLAWFPRLLHASSEQRLAVTISDEGLHWDELDEDISVSGLLAGRGDQTKRKQVAA
jgi:hypothetical protein